mmetsp:Transcript_24575/g.56957  ORF Transcript_24575/g.56957 Transcript_24575/m.56957 type:complete len:483 (-) Transcript_24575:124-1572(-)
MRPSGCLEAGDVGAGNGHVGLCLLQLGGELGDLLAQLGRDVALGGKGCLDVLLLLHELQAALLELHEHLADGLLVLGPVPLKLGDLVQERSLRVLKSLLVLPAVVLGSLDGLVPPAVVLLDAALEIHDELLADLGLVLEAAEVRRQSLVLAEHLQAHPLRAPQHLLRLLDSDLDLLVLLLHSLQPLVRDDLVGLCLLAALDLHLARALRLLQHLHEAVAALHELAAQLVLVVTVQALLLVARLNLSLHLANADLAGVAGRLLLLVQLFELPRLALVLLERLLGRVEVRAGLLEKLGQLRHLVLGAGRGVRLLLKALLLALHLGDDVGLLLNLGRHLVDLAREPVDLLLVLASLPLAPHQGAPQRLKLHLAVLQPLAELIQHLLQAELLLGCNELGLPAHQAHLVLLLRSVFSRPGEAEVHVRSNFPPNDLFQVRDGAADYALLLNGLDVVTHAHRPVVLGRAPLHNRLDIHLAPVFLVRREK